MMTTKVHPIQTGSVRIKTAQVHGRGKGVARQLAIFTDPNWTAWLPTYAFVIEHREGIFVVDTGQGSHLLEHARDAHPYLRWEVDFRLEPEEELGPRLQQMGIGSKDVRMLLLTHLHVDHDGGLSHLPDTPTLVTATEIKAAGGWAGRLAGYLPHRWPAAFRPSAIPFKPDPYGIFPSSYRVTQDGDIAIVPTPGHTPGHASIMVELGDSFGTVVMLAGDASYTEKSMLDGVADGVSPNEAVTLDTLACTRRFAASRRLVYLPTHDPDSAIRLQSLQATTYSSELNRRSPP